MTADKIGNMHLAFVVMAVQILVNYSYMERVSCRLTYSSVVHMISAMMCLLCKKWTDTFKNSHQCLPYDHQFYTIYSKATKASIPEIKVVTESPCHNFILHHFQTCCTY